MPSPAEKRVEGKFYRRKDGAWVKIRGRMVKVGADKYKHLPHYSKHSVSSDRKRRARKSKKRRKYPHAFD